MPASAKFLSALGQVGLDVHEIHQVLDELVRVRDRRPRNFRRASRPRGSPDIGLLPRQKLAEPVAPDPAGQLVRHEILLGHLGQELVVRRVADLVGAAVLVVVEHLGRDEAAAGRDNPGRPGSTSGTAALRRRKLAKIVKVSSVVR